MKIYNTMSSKSVYSPKNLINNNHPKELGITNNTSKKTEIKPNQVLYELDDKEAFAKMYNNATLNNSSNKSKNELSDDEINKEVNRLL